VRADRNRQETKARHSSGVVVEAEPVRKGFVVFIVFRRHKFPLPAALSRSGPLILKI
jgi:hypothetical protein